MSLLKIKTLMLVTIHDEVKALVFLNYHKHSNSIATMSTHSSCIKNKGGITLH